MIRHILMCASFQLATSAAVVDYVIPLVGTAPLEDLSLYGGPNYKPDPEAMYFSGCVYPGATLPHGMVQLSPICNFNGAQYGSGYFYPATTIQGFAHTNKGHWQWGNLLFMPTVGTVQLAPGHPERPDGGFRSRFSHDNESAEAGYYQVFLEDYGVNVELTATTRAGFHRYTFPETSEANVIIDLARCFWASSGAYLEFVDDRIVRGWQDSVAPAGEFRLFFHAEFNKPFETKGKWEGTRPPEDHEGKTGEHHNTGGHVTFSTDAGESVLVKVGLSFVSMEKAKANLDAGISGWDFDAVRQQARDTWNGKLGIIQVEGGSKKERINFYSSLYRALQWPPMRSDADGEYRAFDAAVKRSDRPRYGVPPMWDVYRNQQPLLTLIEPQIKQDILLGLVERAEMKGWMDTYFHGNHAASIFAASHKSGMRGFDIEKAYAYLKKNQTQPEGPLQYLDQYLEIGYVSTEDPPPDHPRTAGKSAVAKTLEYAFNDYCLAVLADALGKEEDAALFMKRSRNWTNVFDPKTGFNRGRKADGSWVEPFYPEEPYHTYLYREGNAWQNIWSVQHDLDGLAERMGGRASMAAMLGEFFTKPYEPSFTLLDVAGMIGQYNHGNQPDHHASYLFNYVGQPWKTQQYVREIMDKMYRGLVYTGMDDCGEMAAWYVWSAIGCYPVCPPDLEYAIGSPVFDKVTIQLPEFFGGGTWVVEARDNSETNVYIQSAELNGKALDRPFVDFMDMSQGGRLVFEMGPEPNEAWGAGDLGKLNRNEL